MLLKGKTDKMWSSALIDPLNSFVGIITLTVGIFEGSISNVLASMTRNIAAVLVFPVPL